MTKVKEKTTGEGKALSEIVFRHYFLSSSYPLTHIFMHTRTRTFTHAPLHTSTRTHTLTHSCTHPHTPALTHTHRDKYTQTQSYAQTYLPSTYRHNSTYISLEKGAHNVVNLTHFLSTSIPYILEKPPVHKNIIKVIHIIFPSPDILPYCA